MTRLDSRGTNERPVVIKVFATSEKRLVAAILREPLRPSIWDHWTVVPAGRKDGLDRRLDYNGRTIARASSLRKGATRAVARLWSPTRQALFTEVSARSCVDLVGLKRLSYGF